MIRYRVGDEFPNLQGKTAWHGSVKTDTITASLMANGLTSGAFTGAVTIDSYVSEGDTESYIEWSYDVGTSDTVAGEYDLCLDITHDNGDQEISPISSRVEVVSCV